MRIRAQSYRATPQTLDYYKQGDRYCNIPVADTSMAKRHSAHQIVLSLFSTHRSPLRPRTRRLLDSDLSALATWPASIPSAVLPVLHKGLRSAEIIADWLFFARPRVQPEVVETARLVSAAISPGRIFSPICFLDPHVPAASAIPLRTSPSDYQYPSRSGMIL